MGNGTRVIEGLRQAVAHAKGEATGAREHVVQVPRPTLTPAQVRALRALDALGRTGSRVLAMEIERAPMVAANLANSLVEKRMVDRVEPFGYRNPARWLIHDHAG